MPPKSSKTYLLLVTLVIIALLPLHTYLRYKGNRGPAASQTQPIKPSSTSIAIDDFSFTEYAANGAGKKFTIEGKRLAPAAKDIGIFVTGAVKVAKLKAAVFTFYENNLPISRITSKSAILNTALNADNELAALSDRISFSGDVTMSTAERRVLICDNLNLDKREGRVIARGRCVLTGAGRRIKADIIEADVALKDFNLKNDKNKRLRTIPFAQIFYKKRGEES